MVNLRGATVRVGDTALVELEPREQNPQGTPRGVNTYRYRPVRGQEGRDEILTFWQSHPRRNGRHTLMGFVTTRKITGARERRVIAHAISACRIEGLVSQTDRVASNPVGVGRLAGQAVLLYGVLVGALGEATVTRVVVGVTLDHLLYAEGHRLAQVLVREEPSALDVGDGALGPATPTGSLVLHGCHSTLVPPVHRRRWLA
mmetsp:Transcript_51032/g.118588  ORF Transcript_51032/g.118588 Transcript_51032/m.118588 type:complete len:202 (-) Transcript_51032:85-690(-)